MEPNRNEESSDDHSPSIENQQQLLLSRYLPMKDQHSLLDSREFSLTDDLSLVCGERVKLPPDDNEFACRLVGLDKCIVSYPRAKFVEFTKESFDMVIHHAVKIRSLLTTQFKAIIFQNMDIQVYVMEENKTEGYMVHFQDKRRIKLSLDPDGFAAFIVRRQEVEQELARFKSKRNVKKKKLSKASNVNNNANASAAATCVVVATNSGSEEGNKVDPTGSKPIHVSSTHRSSFKI